MITDEYNLTRFIDAQAISYDSALKEIKNGIKHRHWMWYIFPQYKGLGFSSTSQKYAISCAQEARMFFEHPILGKRLIEITESFLILENKTALHILGDPDYIKMKSCMTLFDAIQSETEVFARVLEKYYSNSKCHYTLSQIEVK